MAVNRRLLKERLNLDTGLKQKTKPGKRSHLKLFWKNSQFVVNYRRTNLLGEMSFAANNLRE